MSPIAKKIEQEFKKLSCQEQVDLADHLIATAFEAREKIGINTEWKTEIQNRVSEIDSGKVDGRNAFEVCDEIRVKYSS